MRSSLSLLLILAVVGLVVSPAQAGDWDHQRNGFLIGFNVGGGGAALKLDDQDGGSITSDRESGGAAAFRLGYAVQPNLTLGLDVSGWARTQESTLGNTTVDETFNLNVTAFAVTFYPGGQGFFLRAGMGIGSAKYEADQGNFTFTAEQSGFGLMGALGYEWRLSRKFALGPQLDLGWADLGELETVDEDDNPIVADFTANYVNLSVALNWYW